jgi:hypothetical protein
MTSTDDIRIHAEVSAEMAAIERRAGKAVRSAKTRAMAAAATTYGVAPGRIAAAYYRAIRTYLAEEAAREFARQEIASPPWDCDPRGPDALCRMWVRIGAIYGVPARDLPRDVASASRAAYETEIARQEA